jgi:predicted transcriptional regulator of viral defense system
MPDQLTTDPLDRRLSELARRQHGVVSHGQLVELGLGTSSIGDWAKRGRLHRIHRGVYALRYPTLTRNGRFMAAVLACGERAALSHFSAAVLWGMLNGGGGKIHVTATRAGGVPA